MSIKIFAICYIILEVYNGFGYRKWWHSLNLQISLPDRYILSLSKNENKFNEKNKTKQSWKVHSRKASMVLTVKLYSDSFRRFWRTYGLQVSRKTVAKSLKTLAACDSRRLCMRRITYDSAAVNISVFIEQRNISFQNDISLKTMRQWWDWESCREKSKNIMRLTATES